MSKDRCGLCKFFFRTLNDLGRCSLYKNKREASSLCNSFQEKPTIELRYKSNEKQNSYIPK